jgi:arsenate reductase
MGAGMSGKIYNVLFICTGNSARSIMAEALTNYWGRGKFRGYSAGSHPTGSVRPLAIELLDRFNMPTAGLRSKDWNEFASASASQMDFVFTVCDKAAQETCPVWPGQPMTAHWGVPDPALVEGDELERMHAYRQAFRELENRIKIFVSLPLHELDSLRLQEHLDNIGQSKIAEEPSPTAEPA